MERITAPDGATLVVESVGSGPGVVVVHGGGVTRGIYRRLAAALADRLTVHLYDRRGRGDAPPRREPYSPEQDLADIGAILAHTGARNLLGHSSGGFLALEAAQRFPLGRLALYDAAVNVDGLFPADWLDAALDVRDDVPRCLAIVGAGLNTQSAAARLPLGLRTALCRAFLRTPIGRTMGSLLPTTLDESRWIRDHDAPAAQWSGIEAEVLLSYGAAGPPYYADLNSALARALPHARVLPIPRSGHDGINRAPRRLTDPLADFLAAPVPAGT
jgi:pimeloyl-ACP methyl ester carboxylesterase